MLHDGKGQPFGKGLAGDVAADIVRCLAHGSPGRGTKPGGRNGISGVVKLITHTHVLLPQRVISSLVRPVMWCPFVGVADCSLLGADRHQTVA